MALIAGIGFAVFATGRLGALPKRVIIFVVVLSGCRRAGPHPAEGRHDAGLDPCAGAVATGVRRLESATPAGRLDAARHLVSLHCEQAYDALVAAALPHLRAGKGDGEGALWLAEGGAAVMPALLRAYPKQSDWEERRAIVLFVALSREPIAAEPFLVAALADEDSEVANEAAWGLGVVHAPSALKILVPLLRSASASTREAAIKGLQNLGDPGAVAPLLEVLIASDGAPESQHERVGVVLFAARSLHDEAAFAIDQLTHERFHGDLAKIRAWLRKRPDGGLPP